MNRPEDAAQIAIVGFLERQGFYVRHIKNQGKWSVRYGAKLNRMGRKRGQADLEVITPITPQLPRGIVMLECKAPPARLPSGKLSQAKATLSEDQEEVAAILAQLGIPTRVVRSIDEAEAVLREFGVPLRGRAM